MQINYQLITAPPTGFDLMLLPGMTFPRFRPYLQSLGSDPSLIGAVAKDELKTAGLALCTLDEDHAEVISLFVVEAYRGQGLGKGLLEYVESVLKENGVKLVTGRYMSDQPTTPALEAILTQGGWSEPSVELSICMSRTDVVQSAPWLQLPVPDGFTVFNWSELPDEEREAIRERAGTGWYPDYTSPFIDEKRVSSINSIGMRFDKTNDIVGWMVCHRITPSAIRYTSRFVDDTFRGSGLGYVLIGQAVARQVEAWKQDPETNPDIGMWQFPPDNESTIRFVESVGDYLTGVHEARKVTKAL